MGRRDITNDDFRNQVNHQFKST
ncbi:hypothetical protein ACVPOW_04615 [Staphylococcus aureus]